jgi:hypothetical protein
MSETRHERFKRLAEARTNIIIQRIKILGNCSNRSSYDYTSEDIDKIFNAISKYLKDTRAKFSFPGERKFKL